MRLRILGANGDIRGTELETLTANILTSLGYTDVVKNRISHGGHEIDVEARLAQPALDESRVTRLVCECKAHTVPIGINDWLKFLGKVFTEATTNADPVSGLLVALSGINGNVAGHYDTIKKYRTDIQVVSGDKLVEAIKKFYDLRSVPSVIREIQESTRKSLTEIDLAYYVREFVYVVTFSDNCYTLVPSNPSLAGDLREQFHQLVALDENLGAYLDLATEREAQQRHQHLKKVVITALLMSNGTAKFADLLDPWNEATDDGLEIKDVPLAIDELLASGVIERNGDSVISLCAITDRSGKCRAALFRELISGTMLLVSLGLPLYDEFIDEGLLEFASELHEVTPFPAEEQGDFISLLRWSPTALLAAVTPPRKQASGKDNRGPSGDPRFDRFQFSVFRQELIDRFMRDYRQQPLAMYFFKTRGIHEVETSRSLTLKSPDGKLLEFDLQDRIGIGKADDSLGGGFIHIRLVDHAPQPWESRGPESKSDDDNPTPD